MKYSLRFYIVEKQRNNDRYEELDDRPVVEEKLRASKRFF